MQLVSDNLADACRELAATFGHQVAFFDADESVTFAEIDAASERVARGLQAEGVGPGDRVAIVGRDSSAAYEVLFGTAKAGAVLVPLNWRLSVAELAATLADSEAKVVFADTAIAKRVQEALGDRHGGKQLPLGAGPDCKVFRDWRDRDRLPGESCRVGEEHPAVQIYTSGTTGRPKGVVLPHRTFFRLLRGMRSIGDHWMGLTAADRLLLALPQFHIGGLWWAVQGFLAGAAGVLLPAFSALEALNRIVGRQVTQVALVPAMMQMLLAEPSIETVDLGSVRGVLYGGSPISSALLGQAMRRFGCPFFQIYGLTETGNMAVCLRPGDHADPNRRRSAGQPLPGVALRVVGPDNQPVSVGSVGEIQIRSPSQMLGYWRNPQATQDTIVDGWVRTGDGGYLDAAGYVFVSDRIKDMIITAGENVFPAEVEAALSEHPAVAESAVIGVPDELWGESVKALVVLRWGSAVRSRELLQFVRSRLAEFKLPRSIEFVDTLPRNPSGKLLKRELRARYWAGRERSVN